MTENTDAAAGVAALAICESLLLALGNQKLLSVQVWQISPSRGCGGPAPLGTHVPKPERGPLITLFGIVAIVTYCAVLVAGAA